MRKAVLFVICQGLLWLAMMLPATVARAGDEDLTSSVYLVFDPDTGEFVTVEDQDRTRQDHEAQEPATAAGGHSPSNGQSDSPSLASPAAVALGFGLLAGIMVWVQIKKHKLPTR